jgi:hypothetical protein
MAPHVVISRKGVTAGMDMLSFILLNETCLEREPKLKDWLKAWTNDGTEFLEPRDWFGRGHDHDGGCYDVNGYSYGHLHQPRRQWLLNSSDKPASSGRTLCTGA